MLREVIGIDCSDEEAKIAAACVLLDARAEELALEPEMVRGVRLALQAMEELPPAWRREIAYETLHLDPWSVAT